MNAYFADSFFFIALLFESDEAHARAKELAGTLSRGLVTSQWVLVEVADALAVPARRTRFLPFLEMLRSNPIVTIVPAGQALFEKGVALYHQRSDKAWSLTDCMSFVIMQQNQLQDALTGDHHFEQAGFRALLK